jgi:hypothetical protein
MATQGITLGEWLPDQAGITGALTEAKNVSPLAVGYGSMSGVANYSDAAAEDLTTVFAGKFAGQTTLFASGASKIFKFDGADLDLDNVSKSGGYTAVNRINFTQYGNSIIAATGTDKLQRWQLGTSTAFADLDASAPTARFVTVVRDFVVAAREQNLSNKVYWSDINDETDWTPSNTSQSDSQVIPDGGDIQGITGGEFGLVLMERGIQRMSYVGSPLFFQFDNISRNIGCYEPNSIVQYGGLTYFLSDDGFYVCDGQKVVPIGNEKVDRYFFRNCNESELPKMSTAVDPINKLIVWCYVTSTGNRELLIYNWQVGKWTHAETTANYVSSAATSGITLEGLDVFGTIDSLTISLDARQWVGGKFILAGTQGARIVTFEGSRMTADIQTGDISVAGANTLVSLIRPQVDNGNASVAVASRNRLDGGINYSSLVSADAENRASVRSVGKYHRIKIVPSGDQWRTVVAMDVDIIPTGGR